MSDRSMYAVALVLNTREIAAIQTALICQRDRWLDEYEIGAKSAMDKLTKAVEAMNRMPDLPGAGDHEELVGEPFEVQA